MKVRLLHSSPLWVCSTAIRKCWASEDKSDSKHYIDGNGDTQHYIGTKDKELIERVGNKNKHSSTLEHLNYSFDIDGISRACLQEVARHRHASISVKSTRYTLKELENEEPFVNQKTREIDDEAFMRADKYLVQTLFTPETIDALEHIRINIRHYSNDQLKYCLPEAYKTSLVWTINARSLQNFLQLRTHKSALWEIRKLAYELYNKLPEEHKYLFTEFIYKEK